ncbi:DUF1902 domain-containing protein [Pantoea sp. 3_1284]|uniref:DUF1902 domain-containing protein n=1 Tax=Pantoea sp. 3_1284 TaxID=2259618 RepID=UPI000DE293A5|nr:DUF1902 domain-containing protein [Pantoea sp. 3_1284]RBO13294.1 DUF1902 domain-containing protein [Pantoea sp. 3_1284]
MKTLRCMAYRQDGVFVAVCLDWSLAAQGDTLKEAKLKLEEQMHSLVEEAKAEPKYARQLLRGRKAPISLWLKYWYIAAIMFCRKQDQATLFNEPCNTPV